MPRSVLNTTTGGLPHDDEDHGFLTTGEVTASIATAVAPLATPAALAAEASVAAAAATVVAHALDV